MAYTPQSWADGSTSTPISAARLNYIEAGIVASAAGLISVTTTATGNYMLAAVDAGGVVEINSVSAVTVTVPTATTISWAVGTVIEIYQLGVGQVTIAAASGVTLQTPATMTSRAQYSTIGLRYRGNNVWTLSGDLT